MLEEGESVDAEESEGCWELTLRWLPFLTDNVCNLYYSLLLMILTQSLFAYYSSAQFLDVPLPDIAYYRLLWDWLAL